MTNITEDKKELRELVKLSDKELQEYYRQENMKIARESSWLCAALQDLPTEIKVEIIKSCGESKRRS